jgi:hypothetical protein
MVDLSDLKLARSPNFLVLLTGVQVPVGGYVVISRNSTKAVFEQGWGVTLGSNVVFVKGNDTITVNGTLKTYSLVHGTATTTGDVVDGPTISMNARTFVRNSSAATPIGAAGVEASWTPSSDIARGTPGSGQAAATFANGCYISEVSDAVTAQGGSDNEFIEIHCVGQIP